MQIAQLRQISEACTRGQRFRRHAEHLDLARGGVYEAQYHFYRGGFAAAVGAEKPEHLAAPHREVESLDGIHRRPQPEIAKRLSHSAQQNDILIAHPVR